ncbi:MAG TPA: hypothetical protein VFA94_10160 [Acidimicrobiales bacterium]|nr:hypothetical protein [Acidimicrobiales bacterium]
MPGDADQQLRVTVLMKEYDTLRAEILARIRSRFELLAVSFAALAVLVKVQSASAWLIIGLVGGVAVLHTYFGWSIARISDRVAAIEDEVNGRLADELLRWESRLGSRFAIELRRRREQRARGRRRGFSI